MRIWANFGNVFIGKKGIGDKFIFIFYLFGNFQPEKDWFLNHNNGSKPSIIL
jgi:hypothetical protein